MLQEQFMTFEPTSERYILVSRFWLQSWSTWALPRTTIAQGEREDQQDRVDQLVLEHAQEFRPLTTSIPFSLTATQINLWLYQINLCLYQFNLCLYQFNLWLYQIVCRP